MSGRCSCNCIYDFFFFLPQTYEHLRNIFGPLQKIASNRNPHNRHYHWPHTVQPYTSLHPHLVMLIIWLSNSWAQVENTKLTLKLKTVCSVCVDAHKFNATYSLYISLMKTLSYSWLFTPASCGLSNWCHWTGFMLRNVDFKGLPCKAPSARVVLLICQLY